MEKYHPKSPENETLVADARKLQEEEAERAGIYDEEVDRMPDKKVVFKGDAEALEEELKK